MEPFSKDDLLTTVMIYLGHAERRHVSALLVRGRTRSMDAGTRPPAAHASPHTYIYDRRVHQHPGLMSAGWIARNS
jgi:hypothetical protein